jgi:hypothetical protein
VVWYYIDLSSSGCGKTKNNMRKEEAGWGDKEVDLNATLRKKMSFVSM